MLTQLKNRNFYMILGADLLLFALAHLGAYLIRFEFRPDPGEMNRLITLLPIVIFFKLAVFFGFGLYKGMWRYAGLTDMWRLFKATFFSSLVIIAVMLFVHRFSGYSRAVFILDGGLTFLFTGGLRLFIRISHQEGFLSDKDRPHVTPRRKPKGKPIIIFGAGDAGEKTLRELKDNPHLPYHLVGFIDDDPSKKGRSIHGVPVLGDIESLSHLKEKYSVQEVLIAAPSATGNEMRKIVDACEAYNVRYKTLPGLGELINGKVSIKALRDVDFQDLLGRPHVKLDQKEIGSYLTDKRVLVTGAGGSIGAELCRQVVRFRPEELILLDASEADLFAIQMELKHLVSYQSYKTILASMQNRPLMDRIFSRYKPQVVLHAAAYKHVPLLEQNPWEAIYNNILGTQIIMEKAVKHGVSRFVLVSTDKAVRPTNIMGASKRVCELLLHSFQGNNTQMIAVRFGNVVGSSGSVIPLFRKQIARGGPVTVTHPEINRYFMTMPEASQLILQAGALGKGGEIFILEMGTPVKIADMARDLIRLSGKEPDRDVEITYIGLRPGEKLHEELITDGENIVPTAHDKIMVLKSDGHWNGKGNQETFRQWLMQGVEDLYRLSNKQDARGIREKLMELVPEYKPQDSECVL